MKTNTQFKQKGRRLGSAGGFINQLMSNNSTVPKVGEGATEILYSDRHAYEVLAFDEEKKAVTIQRYAPTRLDKLGMSDVQNYEYKELTGSPMNLYYKWGSWKRKGIKYVFTDEFCKMYKDNYKLMHEEYKRRGGKYIGGFVGQVIEGITKKKIEWHTMNIIFGVKEEYYDFSF
ncbi:hypothetical protein KY334_02740 [Candidatus Woesearchaeota archaeon]|nr:hypothetical protein [Candidatus Woesearchaeota archaeon]